MLFMSLSIKQKGIIMAEETKRDIKVFIDDSAISPGLPAEDLLREIAMRLIKDHFAHDLSMSYSIRLDISLIDRTKVQYELKAMFLYRESYTAVSHRIVFYISGKNPLPLTVE
jgi:hypothetical protein